MHPVLVLIFMGTPYGLSPALQSVTLGMRWRSSAVAFSARTCIALCMLLLPLFATLSNCADLALHRYSSLPVFGSAYILMLSTPIHAPRMLTQGVEDVLFTRIYTC